MKQIIYIAFLLLSLPMAAATLTATVDSYTKASLSGDVPDSTVVQFANSGGSKGQVTKGALAEMTVSGLPKSIINSIMVYVCSNKTAGAATITITLGQHSWQVVSGNYKDWPGMGDYSTTALPLNCLSSSTSVSRGTTLRVKVEGLTNSVYLSHVVVDYTPAPPSSYALTLQWPSVDGVHYDTIREQKPLAGVILPSVDAGDSVLCHADQTWHWVGWTESVIETGATCPLFWQEGDWYGLEQDTKLYALYSNAPDRVLQQDSSFTTGEYLLMIKAGTDPWVMSGNWQGGKLTLSKKQMTVTSLEDMYRYKLSFTHDSVSIYHPQSKSWIGYKASSGSNVCTRWAWMKGRDGSLYLYSNAEQGVSGKYSCLTLYYDQFNETFYATVHAEMFESNFSYWRLFPTSDIPSPAQVCFSTLPTMTVQPLIQADKPRHHVVKILDNSGQIIIRANQRQFNIFGQSL